MTHSEQDMQTVIGQELRSRYEAWDAAPDQARFSRDDIMDRAKKILTTVQSVTGRDDYLNIDQAFEDTRLFVDNAFAVYEGEVETPEYKWVFAVPGRVEASQSNAYASEYTRFLPILDPVYGIDDVTSQHTTARLAPSVIETYVGRGEEEGAVVWTPLYVNGATRLGAESWRKFVAENTPGIRRSVNVTAEFAAKRLGAKVMGLGASIPSFTGLGKTIRQEGLVTTTGHAGTVYLLHETVREVIEQNGADEMKIGLLGAGSIGSAWAALLLEDFEGFRVSVYDRDDAQVEKLRRSAAEARIDVQLDEREVLDSSTIIVSAINRTLDLDEIERATGSRINLEGKVIIDDSQPGAFKRSQVEARGGSLVWVVGQDASANHALHRVGGYNFGEAAGLYGDGSLWGCEAEAATVYLSGRPELAVRSHVTPDMALAIGGLCRSFDVTIATPLQSFGAPVTPESGVALGASSL